MAKKQESQGRGADHDPAVAGAAMLRRVFPLLARLAGSGTGRDKAHNRRLLFSQYAGLILVGLFNPVLQSARALVAASGLKQVRRLTGGGKTSLGAFSEAASVFEPVLLEGLIQELRAEVHQRRSLDRMNTRGQSGELPDRLIERLIAADGSVLTALPQVVGRWGTTRPGQWRFHAQVHVCDNVLVAAQLTPEPSVEESAEREVLARSIEAQTIDIPDSAEGHLFLLDRGYRSASLFNRIHRARHDYVCRLNRRDGRVCAAPVTDDQGRGRELPPLSDAARTMGVVADEWITLGGGGGASPLGSDHPIRRITLIPPDDRPSSARQGRVRTDQQGRDELILATTLLDLPAEQIVTLYEHRWQVELFFRFLKHVLGCATLFSAKTKGVEIQLYCAIIASLLLALTTGRNLTRRQFEMVCLFFSGWANEDELLEALQPPRSPP